MIVVRTVAFRRPGPIVPLRNGTIIGKRATASEIVITDLFVDFGFETMDEERRFLAVAVARPANQPGTLPAAWRCKISIRIPNARLAMPRSSPRQRKTIGRVMHEFEHGELRSGPEGKGGKVKNRRQAIAIALNEAGASKYESPKENRRQFAKSKRKEARGETYQQETEGKAHVGARSRRESSRAMGGENAMRLTSRGERAARSRARRAGGATKQELYRRAQKRGIPGRSRMSKRQLRNALD
jgi:hypothetical protein